MRQFFILFLLITSAFGYSQTVLAGWTFPSSTASNNIDAECGVFASTSGLFADGSEGSSSWLTTASHLETFQGSTLGTPLCSVSLITNTISFVGGGTAANLNNGKSFVIKTSTTGYEEITFSYATRGTNTGFDTQTWHYSFNGTNWTALTTFTGRNNTTFVSLTALNGTNAAFNNQATVYFRCTLTGASGSAGSGNNRFDNINISGKLIPPVLPTISPTVCNTTFNVVPGETIAATLVSGATNYRFKFVDESDEEYLVERATGSMTIHQFAEFIGSGFQYGEIYQVSVEAYVNDAWTGYGASCEFLITDDPRTKLRADFCNLPLAAMDTRIFVDRLPLFNQYVYTVKNTSTNQSVTFTRTDPQATGFRLTQEAASILSAGTTYEVTVQAKLGDWVTFVGTLCTVSTPAIPGTVKLRAGSCDVTLTSMINQAVLSEVAPNAVEYQFEVTNTTLNTAPVTFLKSNWVLPMSDLGAGFTTNTTYSIRVRARIGATFNSYGTPCTVTTPSTVPAPKLTALYCDQTFENYRSLYANRVVNSQEFTFEVTNDQSDETIEVIRPGNFFHLANHTSPAFLYEGTSFTIRVKVKVNDTYGDYGTPCVVTIGAPSLLNYNLNGFATSDKIEAYPNPFNNQFNVKLTDLTTANIQVFDINGRLVENQTINDTFEVEMGQNLNAGVYLVRVEQNGDTQSFKMIKK